MRGRQNDLKPIRRNIYPSFCEGILLSYTISVIKGTKAHWMKSSGKRGRGSDVGGEEKKARWVHVIKFRVKISFVKREKVREIGGRK